MLVEGKNLFPLSVILNVRRGRYFLSADYSVYSIASGKLVRLLGSRTSSGLTFSFAPGAGVGKQIVKHEKIVHLANACPTFKDHVKIDTLGVNVNKIENTTPKTSHAPTIEAGVKAKGSIIGRVHKGRLVFGSEPKIHTTLDSVRNEMQRLAIQYPGVKFVECKIVSTVIAGGVTWE